MLLSIYNLVGFFFVLFCFCFNECHIRKRKVDRGSICFFKWWRGPKPVIFKVFHLFFSMWHILHRNHSTVYLILLLLKFFHIVAFMAIMV
jgi:hypothetical protein